MKTPHLNAFGVEVIVVRCIVLCKATYYHKNSIFLSLGLNPHCVAIHVASSVYYTHGCHHDAVMLSGNSRYIIITPQSVCVPVQLRELLFNFASSLLTLCSPKGRTDRRP